MLDSPEINPDGTLISLTEFTVNDGNYGANYNVYAYPTYGLIHDEISAVDLTGVLAAQLYASKTSWAIPLDLSDGGSGILVINKDKPTPMKKEISKQCS